MQRVGKFLALHPADRRLLANAALAVSAARIRLAVMPFRAGKGYSCSRHRSSTLTSSPDRIAWAVNVVSRYLGNVTCLARALAAHGMLARRGYSSCVSIGVASNQEGGRELGLIAHAWLEFGGRILLGGPDITGYTLLLK